MDKKTFYRLINASRRVARFWGPRLAAKNKCKVDKGLFRCSKCGVLIYEGKSATNYFKYQEKYAPEEVRMERFDIDHIVPVVAVDTVSHDWNVFFERLFCPEENLRGLCSSVCHKAKTSKEQKQRLAIKYGRKKK